MGCCIANELIMQGANVELILGPSSESVNENINLNRVVSSQEMLDISLKKFEKGISLIKVCQKELESAEYKIKELTEDGEIKTFTEDKT